MREMKDSGIELVGTIPGNWEVKPLKYASRCNVSVLPENTSKDTEIKYIDIGAVQYGKGIINIQEFCFANAPSRARRIVHEGDTIISTVRTYLKAVARITKEYDSFICSTGFAVFTPNKDVDENFFSYALLSEGFISDVERQSVGVNYPAITSSVLATIKVVFPPLPEQQSIADFLDHQCNEINALTADIQAQIDTLEQYKRSVIANAVTNGLNPDVEMKESGIDDIDAIPVSWQVKKIKFLFSLSSDKNYRPLEEVNLLSLYTEFGVFPHGEQEERGNKAVNADGYMIVRKDDIVVNIILAWMGAIGMSNYDGVTSPAYDVYRPIKGMVIPEFYHFLFRTAWFAGECYKYGRGIMAMRWRTYSSEFKNIYVPQPPIEEQQAIVEYLHSKCAEIDAVIADKRRQLETLDEYKKSLIYEYITGKKEVVI